MTAYATVKAALDGLGYDVRKYPAKTEARTYIALLMLGVDMALSAGNRLRRAISSIQVDLYTKDNNMDALLDAAVAALMAHNVLIARIGAEVYAEDTGIRYIPIICEVAEKY